MPTTELPYVDTHRIDIDAGAEAVWNALMTTVGRSTTRPGTGLYARMVGCADTRPSGPRPLATGSTVTGFRVTAAEPGHRLVLEGRHRFSRYDLVFELESTSDGPTHLRATTRAAFHGVASGIYRLLVIGSGGHAVLMRRLLAGIKRKALSR